MITGSPSLSKQSWQAAMRSVITDPAELLAELGLTSLAARLRKQPAPGFGLRVPRGYVARMRHGDRDDPLLRQVLPLDAEERCLPGYSMDAVGDLAARGSHGLLHKYHGRALLVSTGVCAIHCRYCFRQHFPYADESAASGNWSAALAWLDQHRDVSELILSGGDPLSLSTAKLARLSDALRERPWIRRLRLHTRMPIVLPERIDAEFMAWSESLNIPLITVIHANHANEIDATVASSLSALQKSGHMVFNQAVLLQGVNDTLQAQIDLCERLFEHRVLPYYLHQLDRVSGTGHFEVSDAQAMALHRELAARLPGYLVPKLVREVASAPYKLPLFAGNMTE